MSVWFVSAAWRRYDVTRLALAQRAHLIGELAERGIEAHCVIVADDENLDIAQDFGFATVEQDNTQLGRKFNDGISYACKQGAEYVVLIGSDDWVHVDLFDRLPRESVGDPLLPDSENPVVFWSETSEVITGAEIALVDLSNGRLRRCRARGRYGVIPWILHRTTLESSGFRPIKDKLNMGIDGSLIAGLKVRPEWVFVDPHDLCRVDFKSSVNLNSYAQITKAIGYGPVCLDPWGVLAERYPTELVELARETHEHINPLAYA